MPEVVIRGGSTPWGCVQAPFGVLFYLKCLGGEGKADAFVVEMRLLVQMECLHAERVLFLAAD